MLSALAAASLASLAPRSASAAAPDYTITELTSASDGFTAAFSNSDTSLVVGRTATDAAWWQGGTFHDLGAPPAGSLGEASGVNDLGQMVGDYYFPGTRTSLPFWVPLPGGAAQQLPTFAFADARATGINLWGLVAGTAANENSIPNDNLAFFHQQRAVVWFGGAIHDLGTLGGPSAIADSPGIVNDLGVVVGASDVDTTVNPVLGGFTFRATMWTDVLSGHPVAHDLGAVAQQPDDQVSYAQCVNDLGQVVGWTLTDVPDTCFGGTQQWGFEWQGGQMTGLAPLAGDCDAQAQYVNNFGVAVGYSTGAGAGGAPVNRGVMWRNGKPIDLATLLPAGSGWQPVYATGINDLGEIVGTGLDPQGRFRAFVMKPVWR